jgi:hypothetical protein
MNAKLLSTTQPETSFDLFRLSKSKEAVDICSNTLRAYFKEGLPCYRKGKPVYISKTELAHFIRSKCDKQESAK